MAIRVYAGQLFVIFFVCGTIGSILTILIIYWMRKKRQTTIADEKCKNLGTFLLNWSKTQKPKMLEKMKSSFVSSFNENLKKKFQCVSTESTDFYLEGASTFSGDSSLDIQEALINENNISMKGVLRIASWSQTAFQIVRSGNQLNSAKSDLQILNIILPINISWFIDEERFTISFCEEIFFTFQIFPRLFAIEDIFRQTFLNTIVSIPFHFDYSDAGNEETRICQKLSTEGQLTTAANIIPSNILIRIIKANGLIDSYGGEQYCVISVEEPQQLHITSSIAGSSHPFFDEKFIFSTNEKSKAIKFEVWCTGDSDNKLLGHADYCLKTFNFMENINRCVLPLKAEALCCGSLTIEISGTSEVICKNLTIEDSSLISSHMCKEGFQNQNEVVLVDIQNQIEQIENQLNLEDTKVETMNKLDALPPPGKSKERGMMHRIKRRFQKKQKVEERSKSVDPRLESRRPVKNKDEIENNDFSDPSYKTLGVGYRSTARLNDSNFDSSPECNRSSSVAASLKNLFRRSQANISWKPPSPPTPKTTHGKVRERKSRPKSDKSTDSCEDVNAAMTEKSR